MIDLPLDQLSERIQKLVANALAAHIKANPFDYGLTVEPGKWTIDTEGKLEFTLAVVPMRPKP